MNHGSCRRTNFKFVLRGSGHGRETGPSGITNFKFVPLVLAILLLAAAFRLVGITSAPPGWRDDELLDVMMNSRVGADFHPVYFAEQEGHEPLQHYLTAGLYRLMGTNLVSHRWLVAMSGLLSVALAVPLGRRLFGRPVGVGGAALLAVGVWPLMYARFGLRHTLLVPLMMACWYALLRGLDVREPQSNDACEQRQRRWAAPFIWAGVALGLSLLTYFAARVMPAMILALGFYGLLARWKRQKLAGLALTLLVGGIIAAPMFVAIARLPGGEERLDIVGAPLLELLAGDPRLALQTTLDTLGMFTFVGDPEWLYNLSGRPVFDWLTGGLFYLGVASAVWRCKMRMGFAFSLIWLLGGLGPAFVSLPAASFGHTIGAQPVVYLLAALGVKTLVGGLLGSAELNRGSLWSVSDRATRRARSGDRPEPPSLRGWILARRVWLFQRPTLMAALALLVLLNAGLTLRDYFGEWNHNRWVRFFYHADIHELALWLNSDRGVDDLAITSLVTQQAVDGVALELDLQREVRARRFDPVGAMVWPAEGGVIVVTTAVNRTPLLDELLAGGVIIQDQRSAEGTTGFVAYRLARPQRDQTPIACFDGGLVLLDWELLPAEDGVAVRTWWRVEQDGPAPVKQFVHFMRNGEMAAGADRFDAYAPSLRAGDLIMQQVHAVLSPGWYTLELGLYDPDTQARWPVIGEDVREPQSNDADRLLLGPVLVDADGGDK